MRDYYAPWGITFHHLSKFIIYGNEGYSLITNLVIENGVTRIGDKAFAYLVGLESVTIPGCVKSIGSYAFYLCKNLTSVTIPGSVDTIGSHAFAMCAGLDSVTISNGVTAIGKGAFSGCAGLTSVTIPNSVTTIGEGAFSGCSNLTSVTIPSNVTNIGERAFNGCADQVYINEKYNNKWIENAPEQFKTCSGPAITVAEDNARYSSENGVLFNKNKTLLIQYPRHKRDGVYTIPSSVTAIGEGAFLECAGLTSVTIPGSVKVIGDSAFKRCGDLASVTIEDGVTLIGRAAFAGCGNLTSVTIPNSVGLIRTEAFAECEKLTSVKLPNRIPPYLVYGTFEGLPANACLYVPKCAINAYLAADAWDEFKCVKPIEAAGVAPDCASGNAEPSGMFTDERDGKKYKTVMIGDKRWMAKNLNYQTDDSWCNKIHEQGGCYMDSGTLCKRYGRLYNWGTAKTVCPSGWHLPSWKEWDDLALAAGGDRRINEKSGETYWHGAGKKLKARTGWEGYFENDSGHGTDDYGFSALPGGGPSSWEGYLDHYNFGGNWWTATEYDSDSAYYRSMFRGNDNLYDGHIYKYLANSVRCVQNSP